MSYIENTWAIMDDQGIIKSGTQNEMTDKFHDAGQIGADITEWNGDLRLIEIHNLKN